jgi:tRNA pseudouridine55 synthase
MKIRRLFRTKKVGHTGTLDPDAVGVLPICLGKATKIVPFLMDTDKLYIADVKLGIATETEDGSGKITEQSEITSFPSEQEIENVLQSFKGEITQIPPMYSAVKVKGKKLYEYARANEAVDRPERTVVIHHIEMLQTKPEENSFRMKAVCSKGTYIRTLCVDIGKKLGYPAHMSYLTRTQTGPFTAENAITFEEIEKAAVHGSAEQLLHPLIKGLGHLDSLQVDAQTKEIVLHGQKLSKPEIMPSTEPFIILHDDQLLAIYHTHPERPDLIKPVRVFHG